MSLYQVFNFAHSLTVKISKGIFLGVFVSENLPIEILRNIMPPIYFDLAGLTIPADCSNTKNALSIQSLTVP